MFLCIDTSTASSGIALVNQDRDFGYLPMDTHNVSDSILENINELMNKSKTRLSDLTGIFVIKGPGSFTGLRVGIAVANQFAHQLKIPIVGLRTDEWYSCRTGEKDFIYLQTMNRDEVYMVGFGRFKRKYPQSIISISECYLELERICNGLQRKSQYPIKWVGELSDAHREELSQFTEITKLRSPSEAWCRAVKEIFNQNYKKYNLIEPFYGKEPTITKGKIK